MPHILPDGEIAKGINLLNSEQRKVFNVVHTWAKSYVKYDEQHHTSAHISLRQWRVR